MRLEDLYITVENNPDQYRVDHLDVEPSRIFSRTHVLCELENIERVRAMLRTAELCRIPIETAVQNQTVLVATDGELKLLVPYSIFGDHTTVEELNIQIQERVRIWQKRLAELEMEIPEEILQRVKRLSREGRTT
ncbi:MAG: hypothetical protein N3G75_06735 [Methanothrix sp.]|nr:hypothetical protein [Methanothrix sp.]MCX8207512.1 hypothetical protein [Methanothrix sp.]